MIECSFVSSVYLVLYVFLSVVFFLMIRRPPRSTRTDTLFPYTTLFRSQVVRLQWVGNPDLAASEAFYVSVEQLPVALEPGETETVAAQVQRSEEHTSELQSLMRISYAVFCLKKKNTRTRSARTQQSETRIT